MSLFNEELENLLNMLIGWFYKPMTVKRKIKKSKEEVFKHLSTAHFTNCDIHQREVDRELARVENFRRNAANLSMKQEGDLQRYIDHLLTFKRSWKEKALTATVSRSHSDTRVRYVFESYDSNNELILATSYAAEFYVYN